VPQPATSIRGSNARNTFGIRNIVVLEDGFSVTQPDPAPRARENPDVPRAQEARYPARSARGDACGGVDAGMGLSTFSSVAGGTRTRDVVRSSQEGDINVAPRQNVEHVFDACQSPAGKLARYWRLACHELSPPRGRAM
jgi:hypothetical protein